MPEVAELETAEMPGTTPVTALFVQVVTGTRRNAGTNANIKFRVGQDSHAFYDQPHDENEKGATETYGFPVSYTLDTLRKNALVLSHDNSGKGSGWYVERVVIVVTIPGQPHDFTFKEWNKVGWLADDQPHGTAMVLQVAGHCG